MDLVIGSSSQLAQYFPDDYVKISSRNIDFNYLKNNQWGSVYITFAEQRIYDKNIDYDYPNFYLPIKIIDAVLENSKKIVCYTSCELWSGLYGYHKVSIDTPPNYNLNNGYAITKALLFKTIKSHREHHDLYKKVIFIHPFYFNSVYRSEYFLFGKIFKSIVNKEKITTGNLGFFRDMVHTGFAVKKSIEANHDTMMGSGNLFVVRDFIADLYKLNGMDFNEYVVEDKSQASIHNGRKLCADVPWNYTYENLLEDTQNDIENYRKKNG